jgi:hypothetical protein
MRRTGTELYVNGCPRVPRDKIMGRHTTQLNSTDPLARVVGPPDGILRSCGVEGKATTFSDHALLYNMEGLSEMGP